MTVETGRSQRSRVRQFLFRFIAIVLILAIVWSGFRVIQAFIGQRAEHEEILSRQVAYRQTATAIANEQDQGSLGEIHFAAQVFATNTPAVDATDTPPQPTPTPEPEIEPTRTPVALPTFVLPPEASIAELSGTAVPTQVPTVPRNYDLVNILLLGGDDELTEDDFIRTDSMIIVSVNLNTGTVNMLSLPRDLFVYIPNGTMQRLNTAYAIGDSIGWTGGGFGLLRQTIFYNFGINVHYFVRINFSDFIEIIDTLGGVDVAVDCNHQNFYPKDVIDPDAPPEENYELRTLPIGYYTMDGFDALWYVRTRRQSDDFDRGRRQQKVLRAILQKARDTGDLGNLTGLWGQLTQIIETDLQLDDVLGLLPVALNLDSGEIKNFTMIRTYHTTPWQPPNGQFVQVPNYEPIFNLMFDFYQPPTENQLSAGNLDIAVYNGTGNENWDIVASERLRSDGFNSIAFGDRASTESGRTVLVDMTGEEKGSRVLEVANILNIAPENIIPQPDPNREYDYEIVLGSDYNSCTYSVLPIDQ